LGCDESDEKLESSIGLDLFMEDQIRLSMPIKRGKLTVNMSQQHQGDYDSQNTGFRNLSFQQSLAIVTPNHVLTAAQVFLYIVNQLQGKS